MYTIIEAYVYIHFFIQINKYVCTYVCICVCVCVCMYACICVYVYVYMHIFLLRVLLSWLHYMTSFFALLPRIRRLQYIKITKRKSFIAYNYFWYPAEQYLYPQIIIC